MTGRVNDGLESLNLPISSAAADRNKAPILAVLERVMPARAAMLEIASGTGLHAGHFAAAHPAWTWQPTDGDESMLPSIAERTRNLDNVRAPLQLDVLRWPWPQALDERFDAVFCANMLHISPWPTCAALMRGAAQRLVPDGVLVLYGPYRIAGEPLAPGNAAFDEDLRRRDPAWGLRDLDDVADAARGAGLEFRKRFDMPANNLMLTFAAPAAAA